VSECVRLFFLFILSESWFSLSGRATPSASFGLFSLLLALNGDIHCTSRLHCVSICFDPAHSLCPPTAPSSLLSARSRQRHSVKMKENQKNYATIPIQLISVSRLIEFLQYYRTFLSDFFFSFFSKLKVEVSDGHRRNIVRTNLVDNSFGIKCHKPFSDWWKASTSLFSRKTFKQ